MKKVLLTTVMALMMCLSLSAQDYLSAPKPNEKIIGTVSDELYAGGKASYRPGVVYADGSTAYDSDDRKTLTANYIYERLLTHAHSQYGYDLDIDLRNLQYSYNDRSSEGRTAYYILRYYNCSATVIVKSTESQIQKDLSYVIKKALQNIREGSRLALDQIKTVNGDKDDFKDQIVEILLDEGYKVVAKDYLEKLYEEQKAQQSGIYNDRTTVQENNFSAVGYYINVKQTETAVKVQIINVSTGEYEANVTVNL